MRISLLSILLVILISIFGHQTLLAEGKIPVEVEAQADDIVGNSLVYRIKENIRRSAAFELTSNPKLQRMRIIIITLDPERHYKGISTSYNLTFVASGVYFHDIYLTGYVGICGKNRIKDVAEDTLATIDKNIAQFEAAKKDWAEFGEFLGESVQKLRNQIVELKNKTQDLEEQLKKEKAKNWWEGLVEKFAMIYSPIKKDETQKKMNEQYEEEKKADEMEWQR